MPLTVNTLRPSCWLILWALAASGCGESSTVPEYGAACSGSCPTLSCVDSIEGGLCTERCEDGECERGGVCEGRFGQPLCLKACEEDTECREGWDCWRGACQPSCESAASCGEGGACVDGRCVDACTRDAECPGGRCDAGRCVFVADMGPQPECDPDCPGECVGPEYGIACAQPCADSPSCPLDTTCSPVPFDDDADGQVDRVRSLCIPFNDGGRLHGGACSGSTGGSLECDSRVCFQGQCVIGCDDDTDCLRGQTCQDVPWEAGIARTCFDAPGLGSGELVLATGSLTAGVPEDVLFAVPRDATSVAFILRQTDGTDLPLTFLSVIDPNDTTLFDLEAIGRLEDQPIRWVPLNTHETAAMLVPNTTPDRVRFRHGRTRVVYSAFPDEGGAPLSGDVRFVARFAPGDGRTLRLKLHFAAGLGVTAATAPSSGRVQDAIASMASTYAAAGITVQIAGYADIPGSSFTVIDSSEGPTSEMAQLFDRGTGTGDELDVFFVRAIDGGDGTTLGIAGGIPGPPGQHAALSGGVVAAYDTSVVGNPTNLGQVVAHECGHYLGLFHSTENGRPCNPGEFEGCAPFGGDDTLEDTTRGDTRNMMYFTLETFGDGSVNNRLSEGQAFVLQRNPLVIR